MQDTDPRDDNLGVARSIGEIVDRTTLLVHDEIELAKAEVRASLQDLLRGSVAGTLGGVFAIFGLVIFLQALALFLNDLFDWSAYPWLGYLVVAMGLFFVGGIAAVFAMRKIKKGSQLTPDMAIEEARKTQAALKGPEPLEAEATPVAMAGTAATQPVAAGAAQPAPTGQPAQPAPTEPAPLPPLDEKTAKRVAKEAAKARAQAEKEAAKARAQAEKEAAKARAAAEKEAAKQAKEAEKLAKQEEKARAKAAKRGGDAGAGPPQPPSAGDPGQEGD